jgi:hypothetical protein
MPPPSLTPERAKVAEFYSAGSGTIPPLPWQTFPPPFSSHVLLKEPQAPDLVPIEGPGGTNTKWLLLGRSGFGSRLGDLCILITSRTGSSDGANDLTIYGDWEASVSRGCSTKRERRWRGKSFIGGGRKTVRSSLFVGAMVAARYRPWQPSRLTKKTVTPFLNSTNLSHRALMPDSRRQPHRPAGRARCCRVGRR